MRWWDPWLGRFGHERIYRLKSRSTAAWREGSRIYFSFVYYDEGPRFTLFLHISYIEIGLNAGQNEGMVPIVTEQVFSIHYRIRYKKASRLGFDHRIRSNQSAAFSAATARHGGGDDDRGRGLGGLPKTPRHGFDDRVRPHGANVDVRDKGGVFRR